MWGNGDDVPGLVNIQETKALFDPTPWWTSPLGVMLPPGIPREMYKGLTDRFALWPQYDAYPQRYVAEEELYRLIDSLSGK